MIAAILAAVAIATPSPSPTTAPTPSPRQIFERAFVRLQSYPVPPYAVWTSVRKERATISSPGGAASEREAEYRYAVRVADGAENVTVYPVSGTALPSALIGPQFQGPFSWSVREAQPSRQFGGSLQPDIPLPLKEIARVVAYAKPDYAIELAGVESVGGHDAYHLTLRPLSQSQKHNLRDLWVDVATFDLWQAHFVGTYAPTPSSMESQSDVTAFFAPVAVYWVVSRMVWTWNDVADSRSFLFDTSTINITFPDALPDWLFDQRQYATHQQAHEGDYLEPILTGSTSSEPSPSPSPKP